MKGVSSRTGSVRGRIGPALICMTSLVLFTSSGCVMPWLYGSMWAQPALKMGRRAARSADAFPTQLAQLPASEEPAIQPDEPVLEKPIVEDIGMGADTDGQEEVLAEENGSDGGPLPQPSDLALTSIRDISLDIRPPGELVPHDERNTLVAANETVYYQPLECVDDLNRTFYVSSPIFCHRPLYFEECCLERYGQHCGILQPWVSAAHFFGTLPAMPYKLIVNSPCDCVTAVGPYGPCDDGPCRRQWPPLRWDAAMVEASVVTGLILLIP